ncbi:hypothetical protein ABZP36_020035 [Zizania latifolia]
MPKVKGRDRIAGEALHSSEYRSGERFRGMRVLVVGCGNSGMEMCLDLCEHGAMPFMSVRSGIVPEVESFSGNGARFVDGNEMSFDAVIFATGYRSNVPSWLQDGELFTEDGKPRARCPSNSSWRSPNGLYRVGFSGRGLLGAGADALMTAADIAGRWQETQVAAGANISSV